MAISVDPITYVISIPKADLTLVQSLPTEIYDMNLDDFRGWLNDWEDDPEGMVKTKTHSHNTEVTLGGLTYARIIEILDPYTVTFEDDQYAVNLIGANSNVGDKANVNQVSIRPQNSAGLISSPDIEYASFQSGVWVDPINGDDENKGNEQWPVKTIVRAMIVAEYRGFKTIYLVEDVTLTTGDVVNGFKIIGRSYVSTVLVIEAGADCSNLTISNCRVSGILDGGTQIHDCYIGDIEYMNGSISYSGLYGTIVLGGNEEAVLKDCHIIDQDNPPTIDVGGSGQDLLMPNYTGAIYIKNLTSASEEISIGLDQGKVYLESTITAGKVIISGIGQLFDSSTGATLVNTDGLLNTTTIAKAIGLSYTDRIHIDILNGSSGTTAPLGTEKYPVDNLPDALIIAAREQKRILDVIGVLTITTGQDVSGYTILADRSLGNSVIVNSGAVTVGTYFENLTVSGTMNGSVRYTTCVVGAIINFDGGAKNCLMIGSISFTGTNNNYLTECDTYVLSSAYISLTLNNASLNIIRGRGRWGIINKLTTNITAIDLVSGFVYVDISCDAGFIHVGGIGSVGDDSDDGCEVRQGALNNEYIANAVWDVDLLDHNIPETTGSSANDVSYTEKWIFIDPELAVNGNGKSSSPFNNVPDAVDFAESVGWRKLIALSDITLDRTMKNFTIEGIGLPTIDFDGQNVDKSEFIKVKLTGAQLGSITSREVILLPGISNLDGVYKECGIATGGTYTIAEGAIVSLTSASTLLINTSPTPPIFDLGTTTSVAILSARKYSGGIELHNVNTATKIATLQFDGGQAVIDTSCDDGIIKLAGIPDTAITDNNTGTTVVIKGVIPGAQTISTTVLDDIA